MFALFYDQYQTQSADRPVCTYRQKPAGTLEHSFLRLVHGLDLFQSLDPGHSQAVWYHLSPSDCQNFHAELILFWQSEQGRAFKKRLFDALLERGNNRLRLPDVTIIWQYVFYHIYKPVASSVFSYFCQHV